MHYFAQAALAALFLLAPSFATSQPSSIDAPVVVLQPHPAQPDWAKICPKAAARNNCYVTRDFVDASGQAFLAIGIYTFPDNANRIIGRALLPLGLSLPEGARVAVDDHEAIAGRFSSCVQTGCIADFEIAPAQMKALLAGSTIRIAALNQYKAEIGFIAPLGGFSSALEGPPLSETVLAFRQQNMRDALQKAQSRQ